MEGPREMRNRGIQGTHDSWGVCLCHGEYASVSAVIPELFLLSRNKGDKANRANASTSSRTRFDFYIVRVQLFPELLVLGLFDSCFQLHAVST